MEVQPVTAVTPVFNRNFLKVKKLFVSKHHSYQTVQPSHALNEHQLFCEHCILKVNLSRLIPTHEWTIEHQESEILASQGFQAAFETKSQLYRVRAELCLPGGFVVAHPCPCSREEGGVGAECDLLRLPWLQNRQPQAEIGGRGQV